MDTTPTYKFSKCYDAVINQPPANQKEERVLQARNTTAIEHLMTGFNC